MSFSIIVASYGSNHWQRLGDARALPSAESQGAEEVIRIHERSGRVATARNAGAAQATSDWLVFLDADDELSPGYIEAMRRALEQRAEGVHLLLAPATSYARNGIKKPAKFWPECNIRDGNWLVIGTGVPRSLHTEVGGFDDRADFGAFEDWAFWIKCVKAGAIPLKVPEAIYIAHVTNHSRHRNAHTSTRLRWHYTIGREHYPEAYNEEWLARYGRRSFVTAEERALARQRRQEGIARRRGRA